MNKTTKKLESIDGWQSFTENDKKLACVLYGVISVYMQENKKLILVHCDLISLDDYRAEELPVKFNVIKGKKYFISVQDIKTFLEFVRHHRSLINE